MFSFRSRLLRARLPSFANAKQQTPQRVSKPDTVLNPNIKAPRCKKPKLFGCEKGDLREQKSAQKSPRGSGQKVQRERSRWCSPGGDQTALTSERVPPPPPPFIWWCGKCLGHKPTPRPHSSGRQTPGGGSWSFLPPTSIIPGGQGAAKRLLPEGSSERSVFHPNAERRRVGKVKIFHRTGILFLSKILVRHKIRKGLNKSDPQASCSKSCPAPTNPSSTKAGTGSSLCLFSITQRQNLVSSSSNISRGNPDFERRLGALCQQNFNFVFLCGSSLISIVLWMLGKVSKHSCCLISITYCCCFFKKGEGKEKKPPWKLNIYTPTYTNPSRSKGGKPI